MNDIRLVGVRSNNQAIPRLRRVLGIGQIVGVGIVSRNDIVTYVARGNQKNPAMRAIRIGELVDRGCTTFSETITHCLASDARSLR